MESGLLREPEEPRVGHWPKAQRVSVTLRRHTCLPALLRGLSPTCWIPKTGEHFTELGTRLCNAHGQNWSLASMGRQRPERLRGLSVACPVARWDQGLVTRCHPRRGMPLILPPDLSRRRGADEGRWPTGVQGPGGSEESWRLTCHKHTGPEPARRGSRRRRLRQARGPHAQIPERPWSRSCSVGAREPRVTAWGSRPARAPPSGFCMLRPTPQTVPSA